MFFYVLNSHQVKDFLHTSSLVSFGPMMGSPSAAIPFMHVTGDGHNTDLSGVSGITGRLSAKQQEVSLLIQFLFL